MPHQEIRPVTRDCRCLIRPAGGHTPTCNMEYRQKFFGSWTAERQKFYYPEHVGTDRSFEDGRQYGEAR